MDPKVNKEHIIAYLYGELSDEEAQRVEDYLRSHPQEAEEFESMLGLRKSLKEIPDVEITQPVIMLGDKRGINGFPAIFQNRFFRKVAAVAAVITLGLLIAKFTGLNITYQGRALTIAFNKSEVIPAKVVEPQGPNLNKGLNATDFVQQQLISSVNELFMQDNQVLIKRLSSLESNVKVLERKIQLPVPASSTNTTTIDQHDMEELAAKISQQNLQLFSEIITTSQEQQEAYIKSLFSEFSHYIQSQRVEDLIKIEATLKVLKQESEMEKMETDQVIARLIQTVTDKDY